MPRIRFTANIQRHVPCPEREVRGETVRDALEDYFSQNQRARGYVLDDQGSLRTHMLIFLNGETIRDRVRLSDAVPSDATLDVMQALSGG